jgi:ankyrin repeat protein
MNEKASLIRLTAVLLIVLGWSIPAFCGEIHDAAKSGALAKVKALLKENPKLVFSKDNEGRTPLFVAADNGCKDIVELLLANKAEVNARDNLGYTPLHLAACWGKDVVELLLANGADVNAKTKYLLTPLEVAVLADNQNVVKLLRAHGGHE